MSEIVNLTAHRQKKLTSYGEQNWLLCKCQADTAKDQTPAGFIPSMIHDAQGAFLSVLMCAECGNELCFSGGRLLDGEMA